MSIFDPLAQRYDSWFIHHEIVYRNELKLYLDFIDGSKNGLEIGIGTGRFSGPAGTETGVDLSIEMLKIARKRGADAVLARGENLPFRDSSFNYISLIVTLCFVDDPSRVLSEARRVLRDGGSLFAGIIDRKSRWGSYYESIKEDNPFYKYARFYSVDEVIELMEKNGFRVVRIGQTLFREYGKEMPEEWKYGYGDGSFVLIESKKVNAP